MHTPELLSDPVFHDEDAARAYLESVRWANGRFCPHCGSTDKTAPLGGPSMGPGWYYCSACKDKFTVRNGSIMERSHIPLHKWLLAFRLMASSKKGISSHQLHRTLGITYKSAWFLSHRIREAMSDTDPAPIGGEDKTVEADETFIMKQRGRATWTFSKYRGLEEARRSPRTHRDGPCRTRRESQGRGYREPDLGDAASSLVSQCLPRKRVDDGRMERLPTSRPRVRQPRNR